MSYSISLGVPAASNKPTAGPSCPSGYLWDTERKVCVQKPQGPLVIVTEETPDRRHRFHGLEGGEIGTFPAMPLATVAILGLGGLAVFGGSMAGLTYAHRKKGATWYCSLMPSAFWASLITGVAATAAVLVLVSQLGGMKQ